MVYRSWSCSRGRFPPERELVRSLAAIHRGFRPDGLNCKSATLCLERARSPRR